MLYRSLSHSSLIAQCLQGDEDAWNEFLERFNKLIAATLVRQCFRRGDNALALIDDLIQETYLKLCANNFRILREFKERHENALAGLLRQTALSVALDYFDRAGAAKRGAGRDALSLDENLEAAYAQPEVVRMIDLGNRLRSLNARDQKIFHLHFIQGMTSAEISNKPELGLSDKGVQSATLRIRNWLRDDPSPKCRRP